MRQFRLHFFSVNRFNWLWTTFIPIFRDFPSFVMTIRPVENSLIWSKMVPFFEVFGNYFKNGSNDFDDFFIWCSSYCCSSFERIRMSRKILVPVLKRPEYSKNRLKRPKNVENGHFSTFLAIISKTALTILMIFWYDVVFIFLHLLKKIACPANIRFRSYLARKSRKIS